MTRKTVFCVALALASLTMVPIWAQAAQLPPLEHYPSPGRMPPQASPSEGGAMAADLTGQSVYTANGLKLGTVAAMTAASHGGQAASVTVMDYPGLSGRTVLVPVSSLRPRGAGGYLTVLSAAELKALPAALAQ